MRPLLAALAGLAALAISPAARAQTYGEQLEGFAYPHPQQRFALTSQGKPMSMAFMDVAPTVAANGRTVVLLHGKNFCAATWETTIAALTGAGYRVVAPDQIGFCASTKPEGYQFTFDQLAANTKAMLESRGVTRATVLGHSMGGMLAARYALNYPQAVEQLVLLNPLGLEDWRAEGVPYASIDTLHAGEQRTDAASLKAYQLRYYYNGQWRPEYDRWIQMQAGLYAGPGRARVTMNQAQTSEMLFTQPVIHDFGRLQPPTLLLIGAKDRTAPGGNRAPPEVAARLGRYDLLAPRAAKLIPKATLVMFEDLGHAPQSEAPGRFHAALLKGLAAVRP